ncbi:MAG: TonB family protein [Pseudomonadota bacterium]
MIWSSRAGKITVLLASVAAHGVAGYVWWLNQEMRIKGGAPGSVQARLGTSFADMAVGTLAPDVPEVLDQVEPTETTDPVTADSVVEQTEAEDVTEAAQPELIEQAQTEPLETAAPKTALQPRETDRRAVTAQTAQALPNNPPLSDAQSPVERRLAPQQPAAATPPAPALTLAPARPRADRAEPAVSTVIEPLRGQAPTQPIPPTTQRTDPSVIEAVPVQPTVLAAAPPLEVLQALPEDGVQVSPRPQTRPKRIEQEAAQRRAEQRQQRQPQPTRRVQQGNAQQNATAGNVTGSTQSAAATPSSKTGQSATAGNAAASNYPGQVIRKISRVRRPRVASSGTAVVIFTITDNGGLSGLSILQSSGNARLDQAALSVIQRAVPFPRPPAGAKRFYKIPLLIND